MTPTLAHLLTVARERLYTWPGSSLLLALWHAADAIRASEQDLFDALALFTAADLTTKGREANTRVLEAVARVTKRAA